MIVHVTQKDIKRGRRGLPSECPIALACGRKDGLFVHVGLTSVTRKIWDTHPCGGRRIILQIARMSKRAQKFVDEFDTGKKVKPISLRLEFTRILH